MNYLEDELEFFSPMDPRLHRRSEPEEKGELCFKLEVTWVAPKLDQKKKGHPGLDPKVLYSHRAWTRGIVMSV